MPSCHSRIAVRFFNRLDHFDDDLEMVDLLRHCVVVGALHDQNSDNLFIEMNGMRYPSLGRMEVTNYNRKLVISHLRKTVFTSYIKDLYEETIQYFHDLLQEGISKLRIDPSRIVGVHHADLDLVEILKHFYSGNLVGEISGMIFRRLEDKQDTLYTIKQTIGKLGLSVNERTISDAISYLDIRHQLVHADGKADEKFKQEHQFLSYSSNNSILINRTMIKAFRSKICILLNAVDADAIDKGLVDRNVEI
jgi:hypothetical protein